MKTRVVHLTLGAALLLGAAVSAQALSWAPGWTVPPAIRVSAVTAAELTEARRLGDAIDSPVSARAAIVAWEAIAAGQPDQPEAWIELAMLRLLEGAAYRSRSGERLKCYVAALQDCERAMATNPGFLRRVRQGDLARLYGVRTSQLNQAIKRNADRFPVDFRFQLTKEEYANLISQFAISNPEGTAEEAEAPNSSQFVTSSRKHRGGAYLPWAFTEHGALMAATVLSSPRAVQMSLFVVRAFVQMREELQAHATVFKRLAEIDKKLVTHDVILRDVYEKLRPLLNPPVLPLKEIGFHTLIGHKKHKKRKN